jgi:TPR repeat protein
MAQFNLGVIDTIGTGEGQVQKLLAGSSLLHQRGFRVPNVGSVCALLIDEVCLRTWRRHSIGIRAAVVQGYPAAQCNLGCCYALGHVVTRDQVHWQAERWYQAAAAQGNALAAKALATLHAASNRNLPST